MKPIAEKTLAELRAERAFQPKLQVFQIAVGVICFCVAVLFWILFNVWASLRLFFAAFCQGAIVRWRQSQIEQLDVAIVAAEAAG